MLQNIWCNEYFHYYNCAYFTFREDNKDESPTKVAEINFTAGDAFPLKKDEKSLKTTKLVAEEKKSTQKPLEPPSKKSVEMAKKTKRERRDGSTDSEDSDGEGKRYILTS